MGFDLDPFDDIFPDDAAKNARAGGKFQPKVKPKARPRKESASVPSTQPAKTVTIADDEFSGRTEQEKLGNNEDHFPGDINGDWQACIEKSEGENADIFLGLESFDDFLPQSTTVTETPTVRVSNDGNAAKGLVHPDVSNTTNDCTHPESPAQLDSLTGEEAAIFNSNGDFHIENITMGTQDAEDFPCLETLDIMSESMTSSRPRIGKFQPKPKVQIHIVKQSADVQTECMNEGSIPSFPTEDLDFRFGESIPMDLTSDFHVNEEPTILKESSHPPEAVPEIPKRSTKRGNRKNSTVSGPSLEEHQKASTSCPEDRVGRSSGRLRKQINTFELVDESEDDGLDDDYVLENEDNDNNDEYVVEDESLNERMQSRSKKRAVEKEKPVRKRKKANEVSVESTKASNKKFSHSTRRNKRRVNPDLLKIPEDEMDLQTLRMKDVILLAEHRERTSKNGATTSETSLINQRASSAYYDEDEAFAEEHENSVVEECSTHVNYRTHMKITPRMRWSKQDTELFFEAVQQFGTDLSMIKECFPGRTREQIKSKYKKEERQHPSRLHDALTTRAKDHSHFQVVIERLQKMAAERKDGNRDEPINLAGEEEAEEVAADTNEVAKSEQFEKSEQLEEEVQDMEPDVPAVESPVKSDNSEDDLYRWSQYRSEI